MTKINDFIYIDTQHALQHQINTLQQQIQQQQFIQQQQQQQRPVNTTIQQILSGNYPRYHIPQQLQHQQQNINGRSKFCPLICLIDSKYCKNFEILIFI